MHKTMCKTGLTTLIGIIQILAFAHRTIAGERFTAFSLLPSAANKSLFICPEKFGYFPDHRDCTKYFVCVFGEALHESCTGGLFFSAELQTCDWPRNVLCSNREQIRDEGKSFYNIADQGEEDDDYDYNSSNDPIGQSNETLKSSVEYVRTFPGKNLSYHQLDVGSRNQVDSLDDGNNEELVGRSIGGFQSLPSIYEPPKTSTGQSSNDDDRNKNGKEGYSYQSGGKRKETPMTTTTAKPSSTTTASTTEFPLPLKNAHSNKINSDIELLSPNVEEAIPPLVDSKGGIHFSDGPGGTYGLAEQLPGVLSSGTSDPSDVSVFIKPLYPDEKHSRDFISLEKGTVNRKERRRNGKQLKDQSPERTTSYQYIPVITPEKLLFQTTKNPFELEERNPQSARGHSASRPRASSNDPSDFPLNQFDSRSNADGREEMKLRKEEEHDYQRELPKYQNQIFRQKLHFEERNNYSRANSNNSLFEDDYPFRTGSRSSSKNGLNTQVVVIPVPIRDGTSRGSRGRVKLVPKKKAKTTRTPSGYMNSEFVLFDDEKDIFSVFNGANKKRPQEMEVGMTTPRVPYFIEERMPLIPPVPSPPPPTTTTTTTIGPYSRHKLPLPYNSPLPRTTETSFPRMEITTEIPSTTTESNLSKNNNVNFRGVTRMKPTRASHPTFAEIVRIENSKRARERSGKELRNLRLEPKEEEKTKPTWGSSSGEEVRTFEGNNSPFGIDYTIDFDYENFKEKSAKPVPTEKSPSVTYSAKPSKRPKSGSRRQNQNSATPSTTPTTTTTTATTSTTTTTTTTTTSTTTAAPPTTLPPVTTQISLSMPTTPGAINRKSSRRPRPTNKRLIVKHKPKKLGKSASRPQPVYETPKPFSSATKCDSNTCLLPDCKCGSSSIPGNLSVKDIPQIVTLTFDDAVNDLNWETYEEVFNSGRKNPNGCPLLGTFYVSHEWTDYGQVQTLYSRGHEMASHGITHSFGEKFSKNQWMKEIHGQREILHLYGGVNLEDVRGMRAPFLQIGGNRMFEMLYDANFTYDSSMPVFDNKPPFWPYTLDYSINHECMITPCPTKSFPGVWEVGMVMWEDLRGGRCSMGDACSNPSDEDGVFEMLMKNFNRHYKTNRAPFGLFYHSAWFTTQHHRKGFMRFMDEILGLGDVFFTTNWQMLQWVRNPAPLKDIDNFEPWKCESKSNSLTACHHPNVCNVRYQSGSRFMKTCQPCPNTYPWVGNTGFGKLKES